MIELKNISFSYQGSDSLALDNISFKIPSGNYVAILGHNGSGKSTMSKILSGLYKPTKGEVIIDNIRLSANTLYEVRKKIGIIFQNPDNQFIGSTVKDDIAFGLENKLMPREEIHKKIDELSKLVGMNDFLDKEPSTLSGGQKQRVALASVLALDPEIIIFDEVTSMLDPKGKKEILKIIQSLQKSRKKTLISITHDMDEAILADQCIVFAKGKIICSGKPEEILKNQKIIEEAKIDSPFIYKLSKLIDNVEPTFNEEKLLEEIWK